MTCKDQEEFISAVKEGVTVAGGFNLGNLFPSAKWLQLVTGLRPKIERLHRQIDRILLDIINEHREAKAKAKEGQQGEAEEDLVDVLLKFQDGNDSKLDICLTINNIKAMLNTHRKISHTYALWSCTQTDMYYWIPSANHFWIWLRRGKIIIIHWKIRG